MSYNIIIRQLNIQPYKRVLLAMQHFTDKRNADVLDEIWFVQHPPVFTQGHSGHPQHLLNTGNIPVIRSDRGGQVTFHGPGQQLIYILMDLRRLKMRVHDLIILLEKIVITTLSRFSISSYAQTQAPGVYVYAEKICSFGLRIRKGCTFHGLALNIDMDLSPFLRINPCGYIDLRMTQVSNFVPNIGVNEVLPVLLVECLKIFKANMFKNKIEEWDPIQYGV